MTGEQALLSIEQRAEFDQLGFVRLTGAFAARDAKRMQDRIWAELKKHHGIERDAPDTWTIAEPRHLSALSRSGAFAAIDSATVRDAIGDLLGPDWQWLDYATGLLVTFGVAGAEWSVPSAHWHLDSPASASVSLLALRLLAFVEPVMPGGGGTLVVRGSHRLVADLVTRDGRKEVWHSADIRKALTASHPWLADLTSRHDTSDRVARFMREGAVLDGVSVRVVELTGAAGDAVLVHPWILHTAAPNCNPTPRMMVSARISSRGI
jgi:hypothetical protein